MRRIVGLAGRKGSGKDEAAKALVADGWVKVAFADPLRDLLYILNPIVRPEHDEFVHPVCERWAEIFDTEGYDELKQIPEARRLMQVFGTEVVREHFGQDAWVRLTVEKILAIGSANIVVSDLRFNNEARALHNLGSTNINIVRPDLDSPDDPHVSETGVAQRHLDKTLRNVGSINDLHTWIRSAVIP